MELEGDAAFVELQTKYERAMEMIRALCTPRGQAGHRDWSMSIPAEPERDPDLVIAGALRACKAEIHRLRDLLLAGAVDQDGKVLVDRQWNTLSIDGVVCSMEVLVQCANPNPAMFYRASRSGNVVTVSTWTREGLIQELLPGRVVTAEV